MFLLRSSLAVGLAFTLTTAALAAPTVRRGTSRYGIEGRVVHVHRDRTNGRAGWIKVRRGHHYRSARRGSISARAALGRNRFRRGSHTMTFPVNSTTRFARLSRSVNGLSGTRTTFQAVHSGEHVRVFPRSGRSRAAREVVILMRSSHRSGARNASTFRRGAFYGRRYMYRHRYVYRRPSLVYSRVLYHHGRRHHVSVQHHNARRVVARRPVRHTLIHGRVASHHRRVAPHTMKHAVKRTTVKKPPVHKRPAAHVQHKPAPKHSASHSHPARRKR
ncbi:MAG TPA: hypothetical protein VH575_11345 [Gemmataceae bacterium]|jgi:hypothetical protein